MFLKKYIWLSAATLLTACDLIDYHPYDGRLDSDTSREINPTNIERIEIVKGAASSLYGSSTLIN